MEEKIIYTYVVADLLHMGHVSYLENAKVFAGEDGKLIVGVLTDEATMEKKSRPVLSFSERMRLVKSLRCVDLVVPQTTYSPNPNIKRLSPNILIESDSHSEQDLKETREIAKSVGCRIMILPYYPEQSSTRIKESIRNNNNNDSNNLKNNSSNNTNNSDNQGNNNNNQEKRW